MTEVETLLADPYAFYARRVLGLRPVDPLDAEVGASDYGNLVHAAMARFIRRLAAGPWPGPDAARASRLPAGHPEGYGDAFATLYSDAAGAIRAGALPQGSLLPGIAEGVSGMRFIKACLRSHHEGAFTAV